MARLHLHAFGPADAPVLLLLHGVTNTGARMRRLAEEELPGLRLVAPDLRGHGHSTWDPPWDLDAHVADVTETLDAEGLRPVAVAGHSFGALVAIALAAAAPDRVPRLVLLDPAADFPAARAAAMAETVRRDEGWDRAEVARAERTALRPPHARDTVDDDIATFLETGADGRVRFRFSRPAVITAWSAMARPAPRLDRYQGLVTLLRAARDDYVTDSLLSALSADLGPRLSVADVDSGHMLIWDARPAVGAALREACA